MSAPDLAARVADLEQQAADRERAFAQATEFQYQKSDEREAALKAEIASLRALLRDVLAHEEADAKYRGLVGCTCINHSRKAERAYERGECPHQRARLALAGGGS